MTASIIFYLVLGIQLWLISHYYAKRVLVNMKYVTDNYSEEEYPKLYPKTKHRYLLTQQAFKRSNQGILLLGIAALMLLIYGYISESYQPANVTAAIIFMIQLIPFALLELSEHKYFNAMRKNVQSPVRSSSMTRRTVSTFASVKLQLSALILIIMAIVIDIAVNANQAPLIFSMNEQAFHRSLLLIVSNVFLLALVLSNVYGKKLDPFQADSDRFSQLKLTIQTLFYCSICLSLFFLLKSLIIVLDAEGIEALATAIYTVIIAYVSVGHRVRCVNLTELNFDVYKA